MFGTNDVWTPQANIVFTLASSRRTYLGRVRQYCAYLETSANDYGDPLSDPHARDYAIRDFKSHLKKERKAKPASVNLMLAALDHLYLFLGLGRRPKVRREDLSQEASAETVPASRGAVHVRTRPRPRAVTVLYRAEDW
jgi:hypothetical protein